MPQQVARLITYFDPKALITGQYKILRTNILSTSAKRPLKTLVVTNSVHPEGKTVTALNLAMIIVQSTQKPKVLLIDADMRCGRVAKYLGVDHIEYHKFQSISTNFNKLKGFLL